jgi:hypothetical protein
MRFTAEAIKKDKNQFNTLADFHSLARIHGLSYWDVLSLSDTYKELIKNTPVDELVDIGSLKPEEEQVSKPAIEILV